MELEDDIYNKILVICDEARKHEEAYFFNDAITCYKAAWNLIPDPKNQWEAATWILAVIGDVNFSLNNYQQTIDYMLMATKCPGGLGNPFIHIRLGEAYYQIGDKRMARNELDKAYILGGKQVFQNENPIYWDYIKDSLPFRDVGIDS